MKKRFVSLITVFLCLILLGSILGVSVQAKETIDCVYEENFENGTGKWEKFGSSSSGTLTTATSEKINGSKSLVLYNRVNTWDSPALDLLNVLKNSGGGTYVVNLWVYVENLPELVSPARLLICSIRALIADWVCGISQGDIRTTSPGLRMVTVLFPLETSIPTAFMIKTPLK